MNILQLILLLIISVMLLSLFKGPLRYVLSPVLSFLICLEGLSWYLNGGFIDDRFLYHANFEDLTLVGSAFGMQIFTFFTLWITLSIVLFFSGNWVKEQWVWKTRWKFAVLLPCFLLLLLPNGIINVLFQSSAFRSPEKLGFSEALTANGIEVKKYISPDKIKSRAGKNVIVIYLESIEQDYLLEKLNHLTPNLSKLKNKFAYYEMKQDPGSDWSAGSFYTSISGVPAFFSFGAGGNRIFQGTRDVQLTGIGHIFQAAGYQILFLLGKKEFAGVNDMLIANKFEVKSEEDFPIKYSPSEWGLHDLDLFQQAKLELSELKKSNKPFALYLATVGTHQPDGIYDQRIEALVPAQKSRLERMVAATDYIIGDFMTYLENEGFLKNTVVYIMPDHLLMGSAARVISDFGDNRSLYLITNGNKQAIDQVIGDRLNQIEIPKVILAGADIAHNGKFYADFIETNKIADTLLARKKRIQQLNEASVSGEYLTNGFVLTREPSGHIQLTSKYFTRSYEMIPEKLLCFALDHKFRIEEVHYYNRFEAFERTNPGYGPSLILEFLDGKLYSALKYGQNKIVPKSGKEHVEYTAEDIILSRNWPFTADFDKLPKQAQYHSGVPAIYVTSAATSNAQILTPSEIRIGQQKLAVSQPGLYLYNGKLTYYNPEEPGDLNQLKQRIDLLLSKGEWFFLMLHGPLSNQENLKGLNKSRLPRLESLQTDEAYIAYFLNGMICEHKAYGSLSFSFPETESIHKSGKSHSANAAIRDRSRFIAHAGGAINGIPYTNSLEALNNSYEQGFRYFELDILRSRDGSFVAAHDWPGWKNNADYKNEIPVSAEEFKNHLLLEKYHPLTINEINEWFKIHTDAYLITDKINSPTEFSSAFIDPNRLFMELFSWDAVKEARAMGLKVIVSEELIFPGNQDIVQKLGSLGIDRVSVSFRSVENNRKYFQSLTDKGIKIFVYHLNQEDQMNEARVVNELFPTVYGMYADYWSF